MSGSAVDQLGPGRLQGHEGPTPMPVRVALSAILSTQHPHFSGAKMRWRSTRRLCEASASQETIRLCSLHQMTRPSSCQLLSLALRSESFGSLSLSFTMQVVCGLPTVSCLLVGTHELGDLPVNVTCHSAWKLAAYQEALQFSFCQRCTPRTSPRTQNLSLLVARRCS